MNWLEIEQQLECFWKGETTLGEERQLKSAFSRDDVPAHLESYISYFTFVAEQKLIKHPQENFESELLEKLSFKRKTHFALPKLLAYAAGLLILFSSAFFLYQRTEIKTPKYEPLTAKEIDIAKKYMGFLAQNLEQSVTFSTQNLEKLKLLNKGSQNIQHYENAYQKQIMNLNKIEYINLSFNELKYLKILK